MAIKLVTICDGHMEATEEEVPGETIDPVTLPSGKRRVVDLCGECRSNIPYTLLIELLEEFGRDADAQNRMSRATPPRQPIPEDQKSQCRFCERNDFKVQGRKMHERRAHPVELGRLLEQERKDKEEAARGDMMVPDTPADLDSFCEVCNQQLSSPSALNGHKSSNKHLENLRKRQETAATA